jgi:hypothetical protein
MKAIRCKQVLLFLPLALLLLPAFQARLKLLPETELAGAYTIESHPEFTWDALLSSSYQPALEHYVEDRIGFRNWLIKARNQLAFSLFRVSRATEIIVGKHGVLFQAGPVATAAGKDLLSEVDVRYRVRRLRVVQQDLLRQGINLLFVLAPNKARFEPELLPAHLRRLPGVSTNYDRFMAALHADSIEVLDMVPVFAKWKKTSPYPLFAPNGTHWSGYGATLAADTLIHRLESLGHLHLPIVRTLAPPRIVHSVDSLLSYDNDLGLPLNLLAKRESEPVAYRRLAIDPPQAGQTRPSLLLVGDSFGWGLMQFVPYIQREFADDSRFWYYGETVHQPDSIGHPTGEKASGLDLQTELRKRRFVVVLLTEGNLVEAEFGFTERVYRLYHPLTEADHQAIEKLTQQLIVDATPDERWQKDFLDKTRAKAQQEYEMHQLTNLN